MSVRYGRRAWGITAVLMAHGCRLCAQNLAAGREAGPTEGKERVVVGLGVLGDE